MRKMRIISVMTVFLLVASAFFIIGVNSAVAKNLLPTKMVTDNVFGTQDTVPRHEFLSLLIRETGLNLNGVYFIKAPDVRDVATDVTPEAPYAGDLIVAGHYGVVKNGVPFRPNEPILREEAASMAVKALYASLGPLPLTKQLIIFEDEDRIAMEYRRDVQDACKLGLFSFDSSFRPRSALSRVELSSLVTALHKIYTDRQNEDGVTWKISEEHQKITLYWGEKPTGGYSIGIHWVEPVGDVLRVFYSLKAPKPGDMVTQAITYPRAEALLPENADPSNKVELIKGDVSFIIGHSQFMKNGQAVYMDAQPFIQNGRAMIPVRYLAMALDIPEKGVIWSPSSGSLTLSKGDVTVTLIPGENVLRINNKLEQMDDEPILRGGRVYLPARSLAKALGYDLGWDSYENAVLIGTASR